MKERVRDRDRDRAKEWERKILLFKNLCYSFLVVVQPIVMQNMELGLDEFGLMMSTAWVTKLQLSSVRRTGGVNITVTMVKMLVLIAVRLGTTLLFFSFFSWNVFCSRICYVYIYIYTNKYIYIYSF